MKVCPVSPKPLALLVALALAGALPVLAQNDPPSAAPETTDPVALPVLGADLVPAQTLRQAAQEGGITLLIGGREVPLVLEVNPLVLPDAPVLENGRPVSAPDIDLYRGTVAGDLDSHARLSITDDRADGYVYAFGTMYDIQTHDGDAVLLPASGIDRPTLIDYEIGESDALGLTGAKQGITGCLGAVPEITDSPLGIVTGWGTPLTYEMVIVADKPFTERFSSWSSAQLSHMNRVDGYFQNNFNIKIQIVAQSADTAGTIYTSSNSGGLLSQLRSTWFADPTDRDTVHLLSDREFDGATVGQAFCIGGVHSKLLHYTVTQTKGFNEFVASEITAHELGHMMSAHHHYSNCHDTALSPSGQPCTVMTPVANLINNALIFSMLSKSTIREYGEDVL